MTIQSTRNTSRSNRRQPYAKSATERNFNAKANSKKPKTTFTEFNHPPDFGMLCNMFGKMAKRLNGIDKAKAKPNIPIAGPTAAPIVAACTNSVPMIGPVQENDTSTNVNAMKKMLMIPVVESAFVSSLFVHEAGNTNSNAPKKETANKTSKRKNMILNIAFVDKSFNALAPKIPVISKPNTK